MRPSRIPHALSIVANLLLVAAVWSGIVLDPARADSVAAHAPSLLCERIAMHQLSAGRGPWPDQSLVRWLAATAAESGAADRSVSATPGAMERGREVRRDE